MIWLKVIGGVLLVLIGLTWIGQGFNMITGSGMSGHPIYAALGVVVALVGAWLAWSTVRAWAGTPSR